MSSTLPLSADRPIISPRRIEVLAVHRQPVDHAAAEAIADRADLAGRFRMLLQERHGRDRYADVLAVDLFGEQLDRLLVVGWRAAGRREQIGGEHQEAFQ